MKIRVRSSLLLSLLVCVDDVLEILFGLLEFLA